MSGLHIPLWVASHSHAIESYWICLERGISLEIFCSNKDLDPNLLSKQALRGFWSPKKFHSNPRLKKTASSPMFNRHPVPRVNLVRESWLESLCLLSGSCERVQGRHALNVHLAHIIIHIRCPLLHMLVILWRHHDITEHWYILSY